MVNIDRYNQYMSQPLYLSAREAVAELGIQPATLYAYVSRGLIRSVPGPGKQKRYDASDIRKLLVQRDRPEPQGGARPLSGDPVLETRLTHIGEDGPWYRGHRATDLARSLTLEATAALLWDCEEDPFAGPVSMQLPLFPEGMGAVERLMTALAAWPVSDPSAYTRSPQLLLRKGAAFVRVAAAALLGRAEVSSLPVHEQLAQCWLVPGRSGARGISDADGADLIRAALVLSADHELNTSAFTVRCAASTRAPLHAALIAGAGAFTGPRHGAASDRVGLWFDQIHSAADAQAVLHERLMLGEPLHGFGHSVYRGEDPRGTMLLDMLKAKKGGGPAAELAAMVCTLALDLFGLEPNIDFAFAVLRRALGLPPQAGKTIFCAGRMVGWIAHALEQYATPEQIRPRAIYTGERPRK